MKYTADFTAFHKSIKPIMYRYQSKRVSLAIIRSDNFPRNPLRQTSIAVLRSSFCSLSYDASRVRFHENDVFHISLRTK